jgi:hypothetical protein
MWSLRLTRNERGALQSSRGLPSGGGEQARQLLAGPMNVASGRDFRDAENLSDLLEREPFLVAQNDCLALVGPEGGHGGLQRVSEGVPLDRIGHRRSGWFRCVEGTGFWRRVDGHDRDPPAPERIDTDVMRDAKNPRGQPSRRVERGEVAKDLDEGVLSEIFGKSRIAGQPREKRDDRALVPAHNLLERCLRAAERLRYQSRFGDAIDIDADEPSLASIRSYPRLRKDAMRRCTRPARDAGAGQISMFDTAKNRDLTPQRAA